MQYFRSGFIQRTIVIIVIISIVVVALYQRYIAAPNHFPHSYHMVVNAGETVPDIGAQLYKDGAIRSPRVFDIAVHLLGGDKTISQGEYAFDQPLSVLAIAERFSGKDFGIARTKVTFPEGFTTDQMAAHLKEIFPAFDEVTFLTLTQGQQGYLFPDTYEFYPTPTPQQVITAMQQNYQEKVAPLLPEIAQSGHTEAQIIIMASVIEKEAQGVSDSGIIAGILWKRIQDNMPLQVDAAPITYSQRGLPSTPICNPGLIAIEAALRPVASPYLYYLHDSSGTIHYASTFSQHEQNIQKYLK